MRVKLLLSVLICALYSNAMGMDFCRYPNTNGLVWDKDFSARIRQFLGDNRESFYYKGRLYEQVLAGLGGPSDEMIDIGNQLRFASACRAHSCDEKAAVVIACPDNILAVGILHFDIRPNHFNSKLATLTVYEHVSDPLIRSTFDTWRYKVAKENDIEIATDYREMPMPMPVR